MSIIIFLVLIALVCLALILFNKDDSILVTLGLVGIVSAGFFVAKASSYWVFALFAIPIGLFISKYTADELVAGRKWFKALIAISIIAFVVLYLEGYKAMAISALFIFVLSCVSLWKSLRVRYKRQIH